MKGTGSVATPHASGGGGGPAKPARRALPRTLPPALVALMLLVPLLGACTVGTPGLPRVWPGQAISPNVQARTGEIITLTIRATNESSNRDFGGASRVRTYTAYPAGIEVLDFTSSDVGRLAPDDQNRAWVEEIDTKNRVIAIGFGGLGPQEKKTATLTLRVTAPAGSSLSFRTMLVWANAAPDTIECEENCLDQQLVAASASDPQVAAYIADHEAEVRAMLLEYPITGGVPANPLDLAVGETTIADPFPQTALLLGAYSERELRLSTRAAFTPGEPVNVWYNRPDGSATFLFRTDAHGDGRLDWPVAADTWGAIPADATSVIAHGFYSEVDAIYLFNRPVVGSR